MTTTSDRPGWLVPAGLIALGLIPVLAGAARVAQLGGGADVMPDQARFVASPLPVVVHIVAVTGYAILGAFQFAPRFRRRRRGWHRSAGRLLVLCGLIGALSGLWLTLFHPHPDNVGALLTGSRLVVGSAWVLFLVLGFTAIRRRDVARHRAWMIRGYALGMGAGTQALTLLPWAVAVGTPDRLANALLHLAAWVINLAVAEWIIRRRPMRPARRVPVSRQLIPVMEPR